MNRSSLIPRLAVIGSAVALQTIVITCAPISTAIEIGGDEQMELNKALLYNAKPGAINAMWNDQPFFYTWLIAQVMEVGGPHYLWMVRILSSMSALALVWAMMRLAPPSGWIGRLGVAVLFLTWLDIPTLSVSAMIELNAMALATVGAAIAMGGSVARMERSTARNTRWALGGLLIGIALNIKLTAALVFGGHGRGFIGRVKQYG